MSSLEQYPEKMGEYAAKAFLKAVGRPVSDVKYTIPMDLIVRTSSQKQ